MHSPSDCTISINVVCFDSSSTKQVSLELLFFFFPQKVSFTICSAVGNSFSSCLVIVDFEQIILNVRHAAGLLWYDGLRFRNHDMVIDSNMKVERIAALTQQALVDASRSISPRS